jgi:phage terminase Nu1 subunit (DNA packaging protein)
MIDKLHELFGIGTSDDIANDTPWHRDRMIQIAKLKALLKSRRASLAEVNIAADYAHETGKSPHEIWQVFALIPEAMKHRFAKATQRQVGAKHEEIHDAIDDAIAQGEDEWADRIMRASNQTEALQQWRDR